MPNLMSRGFLFFLVLLQIAGPLQTEPMSSFWARPDWDQCEKSLPPAPSTSPMLKPGFGVGPRDCHPGEENGSRFSKEVLNLHANHFL